MHIFNLIFGKIFDLILLPFHNMNPWIGMTVISFLTALFMLFIFRYTSNQEGIRFVKNKIKAYLLELRLFKDNLRISLKTQGNILRTNLKYISYTAKPMLVMIIPLILILIQLNFWFGYSALSVGQEAILKVKLEEGYNPVKTDIKIQPSPYLTIETPPLRIIEDNEINWRFRANEKGTYNLTLTLRGEKFTKQVTASQKSINKISPLKIRRNFIDEILYPTEAPFKKDSPIKSIEITYTTKSMDLFGWHIHWLIAYFALSIIFGFAFKGVFKIEI